MCNLNKPKTWCLFLGVNNTWIYTRCHRTFLRTWMCFVQHQLVRYVGLRQSPFLIGQLHLNGYMARFVVKIEYQKGNCVGEIGLKGSKYISCSRFHNLEGLYGHLNLHVDLQGWDNKLQDSVTKQMRQIPNLIQRTKSSMELEVAQNRAKYL